MSPIRILVLAASVLLSACAAAPVSNPADDTAPDGAKRRGLLAETVATKPRKPPLASMVFAGGAVRVAGPEGYCLDPAASRSVAGGRGVAVMASCRILSDGKVGIPVPPMLMTVTVGPPGSASDLPDARALAQAARAPLLEGGTRDGLVVAHLGQGGDALLDGGDSRYWRGAFVAGGHVIGLALYAPKDDLLAGARGALMMEKVRAAILRASTTRTARTVSTAPPPATTTIRAENPAHSPKRSTLSRLFGR